MRVSGHAAARLGVLVAVLALAAPAGAATPPSGALAPDAAGQGSVSWTGTVNPGTAVAGVAEDCFDENDRPDPASGCDFFNLDVVVPDHFYDGFLGGVQFSVTGFAPFDVDLGIFRRNADGSRAESVGGSGNFPGEDERTTLSAAAGPYIVALVPFATPPAQSYQAVAEFLLTPATPSLAELNRTAPPGVRNYRASHDRYLSHSEPTIAMDPLDHDHLIAGSKMYEDLPHYLFKIGTYESFDGGRTWEDQGQLPGYCESPPECDPSDEETYRTTSDPSIAFDDEGNAYANVLDAPGGTAAFTGFNMTMHTKRPGQPWTGPTVVHDNRFTPVTAELFLDDKNWIAVDNETDVDGGPNEPGDGKVGTMYICWSFDGSQAPLQEIVVMRSVDGGATWGGLAPGDNTPLPVSHKLLISGIGCHIAIGPGGEVYVTWYDNQLDAVMQAKSTDRGRSFSPERPIASIAGVNEQFEGQSFRNLSIPSTGVDRQGNVYVVAASRDAEGQPFAAGATLEDAKRYLHDRRPEERQEGGDEPGSGSDIVLFKSTDGGQSYSGPVRVNQDPPESDADQFQPWLAVTEGGQVFVSYFDRRNDPNNFFIDTYLSRSGDGGQTFADTRASQMMWDPRVNPPISVSGEFIGDYQGLVADDFVAIPFWNDTQANNLPESDPEHSPYQEVFAARLPGDPPAGVPQTGRPRCLSRRWRVGSRGVGRVRLGRTQAQTLARVGAPTRRTRRTFRYCVRRGGKVLVAFSSRDAARLVVTTAHRRARIGRGSRLSTLSRRHPRRMGRGFYRTGRVVYRVRRGRVQYVAVADRRLIRSPRLLRRYLRQLRVR
jgi:hypothetical protein